MKRRAFLKMTGALAAAAACGNIFDFKGGAMKMAEAKSVAPYAEEIISQVPYSTGREKPTFKAPAGAIDAAHHIYDPVRFPYVPTDKRNQPPAGVEVYRMLQQKLGLSRSVLIQPSAYGTDNRCMLAGIKELGKDKAKGVAVVADDVTDKELEALKEGGVVGLRYNVSRGKALEPAAVRKMAERVKDLGFHLAFWMPADMTAELGDFLATLPVTLVFDHRGHIPGDAGTAHPAFKVITGLMREGKAYVKLSALYHDSKVEGYADTLAIGKAYCEAAPTQVVWGTDWPHPSEFSAKKDMPNDAKLLDLLVEQAGSTALANKILVDNACRLFGFKK